MAKSASKKGWDLLRAKYDRGTIQALLSLKKFAPDFVEEIVIEFAFGTLWQRAVCSDAEKELIVLSSLITQGCVEEQLAGHVFTALKRGVSQKKILEIPLLLSAYIGIPRCLKALLVIKGLLGEKS